ncbi:hypothetical protein [Prevotella sp. 10(H)]|uniref:hypothetical protein n=1 Tax=Prevotella sp. 10(H) TaxID=1158294 RepID=UPI0004A752C9|nr:hypothetical protein [Prevotella sp. 10(H)]
MKIKMLSACSKFYSSLLTLIGGSFGKKALINSEAGKHIVKHIKVVVGKPRKHDDSERVYYVDNIKTDIEGSFQLNFIEYPESQQFALRINNVDRKNSNPETKVKSIGLINRSFVIGILM